MILCNLLWRGAFGTEQEFEALLARMEDATLDFKAKEYELSYEPDKARFIKDILAMANTPREGNAYIVLGVRKEPNGNYELRGITATIDEENDQSQLTERVHSESTLVDFYLGFSYDGLRAWEVRTVP
jgi:predicted HTH transcriptional regulator